MEMIDVLKKLQEIAETKPELVKDAVDNVQRTNPTEAMNPKQQAAIDIAKKEKMKELSTTISKNSKKVNGRKIKLLLISLLIISCSSNDEGENTFTDSANIWNGPTITFTKSNGSDPTVMANQDRLSSNVWITRGNDGGQIYNIVKESVADKTNSPVGTKWAIGTLSQVETLSFTKFRTAVSVPKEVVGKNLVMYLENDDVYLTVKFTSWSQGKNGGFAYERSTKP